MDRRTFIKGAVIAASTPGVVASGEAGKPSNLEDLFHEHRRTLEADDVAWDAVFDLNQEEPMKSMTTMPAVQVGQVRAGSDADGKPAFKPIMIRSDEEIHAHFDRLLKNFPVMVSIPDLDGRVRDLYRQQLDAKLNELVALRRERDRIECECGYTRATEAAGRTRDAVMAIEAQILDYVPSSLKEAAAKASWILKAYKEARGYLHDGEDKTLEAALTSIGRAVA